MRCLVEEEFNVKTYPAEAPKHFAFSPFLFLDNPEIIIKKLNLSD